MIINISLSQSSQNDDYYRDQHVHEIIIATVYNIVSDTRPPIYLYFVKLKFLSVWKAIFELNLVLYRSTTAYACICLQVLLFLIYLNEIFGIWYSFTYVYSTEETSYLFVYFII